MTHRHRMWSILLVSVLAMLLADLADAQRRGGGGRRGGGRRVSTPSRHYPTRSVRNSSRYSTTSPKTGYRTTKRRVPAAAPVRRPAPVTTERPRRQAERVSPDRRQGARDDRDDLREERRDFIEERQEDRQDFVKDRYDDRRDFIDDMDEERWRRYRRHRYWWRGHRHYTTVVYRSEPCPDIIVVNDHRYYHCDEMWYDRVYYEGDVNYMVVSAPPGVRSPNWTTRKSSSWMKTSTT